VVRRFLAFGLLALTSCSLFQSQPSAYVVFFEERSAALDAPARKAIAEAATLAKDDPTAAVSLTGYTDSAGSPQADVVLSQQRAQAVADALVADGVERSRLIRQGRGQTGTEPGLMSRRVEIRIGTN
jgi:outer membrane protein OmpA-like peptidoglycan-associated protein